MARRAGPRAARRLVRPPPPRRAAARPARRRTAVGTPLRPARLAASAVRPGRAGGHGRDGRRAAAHDRPARRHAVPLDRAPGRPLVARAAPDPAARRGDDPPATPPATPRTRPWRAPTARRSSPSPTRTWALLPRDRRPNWYDPGRFWSGDRLTLREGYSLGGRDRGDACRRSEPHHSTRLRRYSLDLDDRIAEEALHDVQLGAVVADDDGVHGGVERLGEGVEQGGRALRPVQVRRRRSRSSRIRRTCPARSRRSTTAVVAPEEMPRRWPSSPGVSGVPTRSPWMTASSAAPVGGVQVVPLGEDPSEPYRLDHVALEQPHQLGTGVGGDGAWESTAGDCTVVRPQCLPR